ncbi:phosphoglycolate phosphatase-like isoform X1 [Lampetra planeri]
MADVLLPPGRTSCNNNMPSAHYEPRFMGVANGSLKTTGEGPYSVWDDRHAQQQRRHVEPTAAGVKSAVVEEGELVVGGEGCPMPPSEHEPALVIFDKDGTLMCFHSMWGPWCEEIGQRVLAVSGRPELLGCVYRALGYDGERRVVRLGSIAEKTMQQVQLMLREALQREHGLEDAEVERVVRVAWKDDCSVGSMRPLGDLVAIFRRLKERGFKIAICTSDSRAGTEEFIDAQGLTPLLDSVVCGDDAGIVPKPSPSLALDMCRRLGVEPSRAAIVGDTPTDVGMGRAARLGLTVGVLCGVGVESDLLAADVIVPDVETAAEIALAAFSPRGGGCLPPVRLTPSGVARLLSGAHDNLGGGRPSS